MEVEKQLWSLGLFSLVLVKNIAYFLVIFINAFYVSASEWYIQKSRKMSDIRLHS